MYSWFYIEYDPTNTSFLLNRLKITAAALREIDDEKLYGKYYHLSKYAFINAYQCNISTTFSTALSIYCFSFSFALFNFLFSIAYYEHTIYEYAKGAFGFNKRTTNTYLCSA